MTHEAFSIGAMLLIGLAGAGHCVGMCGGIMAALSFSADTDKARWPLLISYNLGRISSYAIAGAAVGGLGYMGQAYLSLGPALRITAGILLILMGCYLADWWRVLTWLEKLGSKIWQKLQPVASNVFQVRSPAKGFAFGMLWGWLPCGLVYSALAYAAASAKPLNGALAMAAFGIGTLPGMVLGGAFSQQLKALLQRKSLRSLMALAMIAFGVWTILGVQAMDHSLHDTNSTMHQHHGH